VDFFSHKNFVDVLFSLDSKFDGKVIKISNKEYYLKNIKFDKEIYKKFNTDYLKSLEILPYKDGIKVKIEGKEFTTKFDLTPEGYGIRLRIKSNIAKNEVKELMAQNPQSGIDYLTYFIILTILIILAIILWIIKKKSPKLPVKKDISMGVLIQKPIDAKNKIVLYEFNKRKYLLLIGNTNILLDVFDENMINISSKREFDEFLENHKIDEVKKYIKNAEELKEFDERI
jgi:hypothetical protein